MTAEAIMTKNVVCIGADALLVEAVQQMADKHFDGLPVVDGENKLIGIVTEYDMINNTMHVHLPTLQRVMENMHVMDGGVLEKEKKNIASLKVGDIMNKDPLILSPENSLQEVVTLFRDHHRVNPVPVIDAQRKVVGIISRIDIIKLFKFVS